MKKVIQILSIIILSILYVDNVSAVCLKKSYICSYRYLDGSEGNYTLNIYSNETGSINNAPQNFLCNFKSGQTKSGSCLNNGQNQIEYAMNIIKDTKQCPKYLITKDGLFYFFRDHVTRNEFQNTLQTGTYKILTVNPSSSTKGDYNSISCGALSGIPIELTMFSANLISIIKMATPILLIILGMIDFVKATMANDEKVMKESQSKFIRRIIGAVAIFLVVTVIQFIFNVIGTENTNEMAMCINYFINCE